LVFSGTIRENNAFERPGVSKEEIAADQQRHKE